MRSGDWIATYSGRKWFITDPCPGDVDINDIAHGLSLICRFGGQCIRFYSVAEHSVRVMRAANDRRGEVAADWPDRIWNAFLKYALLHDATEAYLGDMVRPLKQSMENYRELEHVTEKAIFTALDVIPPPARGRELLKKFDNVLLMTERRDLIHNPNNYGWTPREVPLDASIIPWKWWEARQIFLSEWNCLNTQP